MKACKKCGAELVIRQTKRTPSQAAKPYYYTAYYLCPSCGRIYHDDQFKVVNQTASFLEKNVLFNDSSFDAEIWTDGACSNNGKPQAKAAWAFVSGAYEANGRVEGKQTNNRGEALAIYHALSWAGEKGFKNIRLHTDSQISIHGVLKDPEKVKENRDIFQDIHDVIKKYQLTVDFQKVLGHSGNVNNERADKLATSLVLS